MNDNTPNKVILTNGTIYKDGALFNLIKYGIVKNNVDPDGLGRIQVFIEGTASLGGDDGTPDKDLPWCFPFLPKHLSVIPKKGDMVWIMVFDKNNQFANRLYVGPIVSQLDKLDGENAKTSSMRGLNFSPTYADMFIDSIPELDGVFPNTEDISIQGRDNTDITQKPNEIVLRAGKFVKSKPNINNPYGFTFNKTSQGYIQLKNNVQLTFSDQPNQNTFGTVTNIVSNKINLLTHNGSKPYLLNTPDVLISEEELATIIQTAHQLPFGDIVLKYLRLLKEAFINHVHNGSGRPPVDLTSSGNKLSVKAFKEQADELEKSMLSNNIRIN